MILVLFLWSCSTDEKEAEQGVCNSGSHWESGTQAFAEVTEDWGLSGLEVTGTRIVAADYDGDGWTDLFVSKNDEADDFSSGERRSWLLRNVEGTGFVDVTESSGVRGLRNGGGSRPGQTVAFADVDNDGDLDVFTGYSGEGSYSSEIMLNQGDGTFIHGPQESDIHSVIGKPAGAAFVDHNLDGSIDLWIGQGSSGQDRLLWGMRDGSFVDVTQPLGLTTKGWNSISDLNAGLSHSNAWSAAACDLNNDGFPELLAGSYGRAPNHLWLNKGGEIFENRSVASGYAFDEIEDWSDNESARCWCTLNPGDPDCAGVEPPKYINCSVNEDAFRWNHSYDREAFRLGGNSGTTVCADVNNDGWMDLLTTEIVHWDVGASSDPSELLLNQQDPDVLFSRPGNEITGLTREYDILSWNDGDITGAVFDFDNDAWPDIYIGSTDYPSTRGLLFHQTSAEKFVPVPLSDGIDHRRSHGVAVADFDRDGDLDLVIGHSKNRCQGECYETAGIRMFAGQFQDTGNFVQFRLKGIGGTNKSAIGARVSVTAGGVTQTQEVSGGFGHYGAQNDLVLHFGLGEACEADVEVRWPNSELTEQSFGVRSGNRYQITENEDPEIY